MEKRKLLIFTAVQIETNAVVQTLGLKRQRDGRGIRYSGSGLELYQIGVGAVRFPVELNVSRITEHGVCGVILAGLAGALDPALAIGDVVTEAFPADAWGALPYRRGTICTSDQLVTTASQKADLYRQTGAVAVEMEGRQVRKFAAEVGLPFLSVRAISDTAREEVDLGMVGFIDEFGRTRPAAAAFALIRRPRLIGPTLRLARNAGRAANTLAAALGWLARSGMLHPAAARPAREAGADRGSRDVQPQEH